ncbi:unnamed protein product [Nippostrongylus brasiliensis]|uniref:Secreted protein n=1 Tax=Nippostrongylus brasiliensis TaxID=27835 RepID=A0A0N4Y1M4_NIPBR|nr:unnamed protein product [Nippostrongylus brasiliensis]
MNDCVFLAAIAPCARVLPNGSRPADEGSRRAQCGSSSRICSGGLDHVVSTSLSIIDDRCKGDVSMVRAAKEVAMEWLYRAKNASNHLKGS